MIAIKTTGRIVRDFACGRASWSSMAIRADLGTWVVEALNLEGGEATVAQVARRIWEKHEDELRRSGDLFFTWQYDMRWAATKLRKEGALAAADPARQSVWALKT